MLRTVISIAVGALITAGCASPTTPSNSRRLSIVSWNLEHLAEGNGSGCRPRIDTDYAALRQFAATLDADVIAFQEVENEKAAARVFDPSIYRIEIEARPGTPNSAPPCNGAPGLRLNRQATGFAIKKALKVDRHSDLVALQLGDPNLRSGVDITVMRSAAAPVRLLSVHLKSGCASGSAGESRATLNRQIDVLKDWTKARSLEAAPFALTGDFNRRLALPNDPIWARLDDPAGSGDLALAAGASTPKCDPRYNAFIDHVVIDPRLARTNPPFSEITYEHTRLSDHCPIRIEIGKH